ncbi:MAG: dockerin type I repeat-containing protein [Sodaliphilus sp.]
MKKFLLVATLALITAVSVMAKTDGQTYEPVNGYNLVNLWIKDRVHTPDLFNNAGYCNTRARTAVMTNGVIYIARSEAKAVIIEGANGNDTISQAVIYRLDAKTGEELTPLDVTLNGAPYGAFLGVNSIGVDNFGHVWIGAYTSEKSSTGEVYQLNIETGEITLVASLSKGDRIARIDYWDVMGDITRENAECNIMAAGSQSELVYRWHADQGSDTFEGGFEGDTFIAMTAFYPESVTQWSYAPYVRMCLGSSEDDMYMGELFYVDGFNSAPLLYDVTGSLIDSFENVDSSLFPEAGTNGIAEFNIDGRNFVLYSIAQYDKAGHGCQANICEMGEGMSLGGMTKYWQIPADSLGKMSDTGTRVHSFNVEYSQENGEEVVTMLTFKCYNGIGVYKMGKNVSGGGDEPQPLTGDVNGDGVVNVSDVTALVNKILGDTTYSDTVCDINGDGEVNVSDVTNLVNLILG